MATAEEQASFGHSSGAGKESASVDKQQKDRTDDGIKRKRKKKETIKLMFI